MGEHEQSGEGDVAVGLDLGSARCGIVVARAGRPTWSATIAVGGDIGGTVRALWDVIAGSGARRVVVEWSPVFAPANATGAAMAAMGRAHEAMAIMLDRIEQRAEGSGVVIERLHPNTVRARIEMRREPGESADAAVTRALVQRLGPELVATLATADERDAAAVVIASAIKDRDLPTRHDGKRIRKKYPDKRVRKLGTRRQRNGHPSDDAFDRLMRDKGLS